MWRKNKFFLLIGFVLITLLFFSLNVFGTKTPNKASEFLNELFKHKEVLENDGKTNGEDYKLTLTKINNEEENILQLEAAEERNKLFDEERQRVINNAPKDEKGEPIIPLKEIKPDLNNPYPDAGYIGEKGSGLTFFPVIYKNMDFYNYIIAQYHILVSAKYKDSGKVIILNIYQSPDGKNDYREENELEKGIDKIYFTGLSKDMKYALFTYNNDLEGYFDLDGNKAHFTKYTGEWGI